jgi:hypothetical protein
MSERIPEAFAQGGFYPRMNDQHVTKDVCEATQKLILNQTAQVAKVLLEFKEEIKDQVDRIEKILVIGNGKPGLVSRVDFLERNAAGAWSILSRVIASCVMAGVGAFLGILGYHWGIK